MTVISTLLATFSKDGISSPKACERNSACAARIAAGRARQNERIAEIQKELKATEKAFADLEASAKLAAETARLARGADIVSKWYTAVKPLVVAWRDQPTRTTSEALRILLLDVRKRAEEELGTREDATIHYNPYLLTWAFLDEMLSEYPAAATNVVRSESIALNCGVTDWFGTTDSDSALGDRLAFYTLLCDLENKLERAASYTTGHTPDNVATSRYAALHNAPTHRDHNVAALAFDAAQKAAAQAHMKSTYVAPVGKVTHLGAGHTMVDLGSRE